MQGSGWQNLGRVPTSCFLVHKHTTASANTMSIHKLNASPQPALPVKKGLWVHGLGTQCSPNRVGAIARLMCVQGLCGHFQRKSILPGHQVPGVSVTMPGCGHWHSRLTGVFRGDSPHETAGPYFIQVDDTPNATVIY